MNLNRFLMKRMSVTLSIATWGKRPNFKPNRYYLHSSLYGFLNYISEKISRSSWFKQTQSWTIAHLESRFMLCQSATSPSSIIISLQTTLCSFYCHYIEKREFSKRDSSNIFTSLTFQNFQSYKFFSVLPVS